MLGVDRLCRSLPFLPTMTGDDYSVIHLFFGKYRFLCTFAIPKREGLTCVEALLKDGEVAQLVRAHDS